MFVLAEIKDVARVMPSHFSEDRLERIELEINKKYANKVSRCTRHRPSIAVHFSWPPTSVTSLAMTTSLASVHHPALWPPKSTTAGGAQVNGHVCC